MQVMDWLRGLLGEAVDWELSGDFNLFDNGGFEESAAEKSILPFRGDMFVAVFDAGDFIHADEEFFGCRCDDEG